MATAPIDLRSDTVTRPTPGMRRAMAEAEVGDDVYGEDPTVRTLEARVAERLGLEAAVFVPSGTQGNQVAIGVHTRPGEEVILENTHNRGGGTVWKPGAFADAVATARAAGLRMHLDGARLFNAEVAAGVPVSTWARLTDSTTVCFSKGLGAPVGSVLAGSKDFIVEARRLRKRLGGGMRQAGILAAACLYALDHHVARLGEDHENARVLARRLSEIPGVRIELDRVETNMVYAEVPVEAPPLVARLRSAGLLVNSVGPHALRLVCHLDVDRAGCERAAEVLRASLEGR